MEKFSISARRLGRLDVGGEEVQVPLDEMFYGAES